MNKLFLKSIFLFFFIAVPVIYNSCGSTHSPGSFNSLSSMASIGGDNCLPVVKPGVEPIWNYLQPKCSTCHYQGTTSAPQSYFFADSNFTTAMIGFGNIIKSNPQKLYDKVLDPAHFGGAGPSNAATMDPLKSQYMSVAQAYTSCLNTQSPSPGPGGSNPPSPSLDPTSFTIEKTIPPNLAAPLVLVWNLTNEMQGGQSLAGAQFQITIRSNQGRYEITAPNARGTTTSAIAIRNIRIILNGSVVPVNNGGGTWTSMNNLAPSSRLHPLAQGTGVMLIQADVSRANTIGIGFGMIGTSADYPDFNPTTYARLTSTSNAIPAAERVFQQRCLNCHGANGGAGGVGFGINSLAQLKLSGHVVPFMPEFSSVYGLMALPNGTAGLMPPAGRRPDEEIRWVRDWILDGAP